MGVVAAGRTGGPADAGRGGEGRDPVPPTFRNRPRAMPDVEGADVAEEARRHLILGRHSHDIVTVLDGSGRIRYSALSGLDLLGYPFGTMIGRNAAELIHPDDADAAWSYFAEVVARPGRAEQPVTFRLRHRDGHYLHVEAVANNLLDDPEVEGIVVTIRDVTDRVRAERRVDGQARILRMIATGAPLATTLSAIEGFVAHELEPNERCAVLVDHDGAGRDERSRGVLPVLSADGSRRLGSVIVEPPTLGDREAVVVARDLAAIAIERAQAEARLAHLALHDPLTGLANRALLRDRLDLATARLDRSGGMLGLLFADLDGFKAVNDTWGHHAGDHVLVVLARRLRAAVRAQDTVARLGGDEFAVLCEGLEGPEELEVIAGRIRGAIAEEVELASLVGVPGVAARVTASIGWALATSPEQASTLLQRADSRMYEAKAAAPGNREPADRD